VEEYETGADKFPLWKYLMKPTPKNTEVNLSSLKISLNNVIIILHMYKDNYRHIILCFSHLMVYVGKIWI